MSSPQQAHERDALPRALPHVVAVTSGKGGVGKSTITVNLGIALARGGARVCVFDADSGLANLNILLGLTPRLTLEHVVFGAKPIEEVLLKGPHGLALIPGANGISECVSLLPRQQQRLTQELARIEGDYDYLLLDTAAGIADSTLDCVASAQQVLLVITPEPTSLTDAFSMIRLLQRRRPMRYQLVVNMCADVQEAQSVYARFSGAVEKFLGAQIQLLGVLPRDENLRAAVTLQRPVAVLPESDPSCRSFLRLADALQQSLGSERPTVGFAAFWSQQCASRDGAMPVDACAPEGAPAARAQPAEPQAVSLEVPAVVVSPPAQQPPLREERAPLGGSDNGPGYDTSRFGSQLSLIELLRARTSEQSVLELIDGLGACRT